MIFIDGFAPAAALIVAMRCTIPLAAAMSRCFGLKSGGKTAALQITSASRSLYQRPATGRNQGRQL